MYIYLVHLLMKYSQLFLSVTLRLLIMLFVVNYVINAVKSLTSLDLIVNTIVLIFAQ